MLAFFLVGDNLTAVIIPAASTNSMRYHALRAVGAYR